MIRRLSLLFAFLPLAAAALPQGFRELSDGLRFDGAHWIETGYCRTITDAFDCRVSVDETQQNADAAIFGAMMPHYPDCGVAFYVRKDGADAVQVRFDDTPDERFVPCGGRFPRATPVDLRVNPYGAVWEFGGGSGGLPLDGTAVLAPGRTQLIIGNLNVAEVADGCRVGNAGCAMTLHGFRIFYGGRELRHDYVPCVEVSSCRYGLYDTIDGAFLPLCPEVLCLPRFTAISVVRIPSGATNVVLVATNTIPGVAYDLRRAESVSPRTGYDTIATDVARDFSMRFVDDSPNRPPRKAFYLLVERANPVSAVAAPAAPK